MKPNSFEQQAKLIQLESFKANLKKLRNDYKKVQKLFDDLCDDLDNRPINEQYLQDVSTKLTMCLAEMDIIEIHIKSIGELIKALTIELSN